jgi:hypothetical protein
MVQSSPTFSAAGVDEQRSMIHQVHHGVHVFFAISDNTMLIMFQPSLIVVC